MEKLKQIRANHGMTQEQLAEMLKTTQQTIARWETGKSEPNIAALKDLAVIFGTSVDDLLGQNPLSSSDEVTTNRYHFFAGSNEGFWGHLGLRVPGATKSTWYPITAGEAARINNQACNVSDESPWIVATTLNNRALVINAKAIKKLSILDDDADEPADDWELDWDSYNGYPQEIYKAIDDYAVGAYEEEDSSEAFKATIEDIIKENDVSQDLLYERLRVTRVHYRDGSADTWYIDDEVSWTLFSTVELDRESLTFDLSCKDQGLDIYVSQDQVAVIDMPLHAMTAAAKRELETLRAEEAEDATKAALEVASAASRVRTKSGTRTAVRAKKAPKPKG